MIDPCVDRCTLIDDLLAELARARGTSLFEHEMTAGDSPENSSCQT